MSVILEFSIDSEQFSLGRLLPAPSAVQLELERIVPTGNELLPFVWAEGAESALDEFERAVQSRGPGVALTSIDQLEGARLYEITWDPKTETLIEGLVSADGTLFEGRRLDGVWHFTVRFPNHANVTTFHDFLTEHRIDVRMDSLTSVAEGDRGGYDFGLTPEQREVLVEAVEGGYFLVPRETDLDDLAGSLDISPQAASERIRRGTDAVLRKVLLGD